MSKQNVLLTLKKHNLEDFPADERSTDFQNCNASSYPLFVTSVRGYCIGAMIGAPNP